MLKSTQNSTTVSFGSMKTLYLLFAIAGTITPWYWLLQDLSALLSPTLFLQQTFANAIASTWATDLLISAVVFFCWVWIELKRLNVSRSWMILYIGLTIGVGLCCSLPFFRYHREQLLERHL